MGQLAPSLRDFRELRILVLHNRDFEQESGGTSDQTSRTDVLNAARDVARALVARGHFVEMRGADVGDISGLLEQLQQDQPDLVFNLCESLGGDARNEVVVPTLLDMLQIAYTGSGPLALGLALRKDHAKEILRSVGVPTPRWAVLPEEEGAEGDDADARLLRRAGVRYPVILKPTREDASIGISAASVVENDRALGERAAALRAALQQRQPLLAEEYIDGRELYVSLIGRRPMQVLPLHEIDFSRMPNGQPRIVCYQAKWETSSDLYAATRPVQAGRLPPATQARIEEVARAAFLTLGVTDYGRCDVRLAADGTPYVIDINPNCDLSDGAGFSLAARAAGISYEQMIEQIGACALLRFLHAGVPLCTLSVLHRIDPQAEADRLKEAAVGPAEGRSAPLQGRRQRSNRQRAV